MAPDEPGAGRPDATAAVAPREAAARTRALWATLLVLTTGFALSQAFRTLAAIMAAPLQAEFGLSPRQLGLFAGAFHFAFGGLQLVVGIGIDLQGLRRTVLLASPLMVLGSAVSALATSFPALLTGQVLVGMGCAPAFLVCTVYIARHFPAERFAAVSGTILAVGSLGMLATGTPLAWLIEASSWRMGFWVLALGSALSWLAIARWVHEPGPVHAAGAPRESLGAAVRTFGRLFRLPHTAGIVLFALVCYASFVALRGLWLGPLMIQRHSWSLVEAGHLAIAMTLFALIGPPLFGRLDPGPPRRRRWLFWLTVLNAALLAALAVALPVGVEVALVLAFGLLSGYMVLQYPDVKGAYPAAVTGRAMALFTMAMFLGVALMQWSTGAMASAAQARGIEPFSAVFSGIAAFLLAGALALRLLPQPPAADEAAVARTDA